MRNNRSSLIQWAFVLSVGFWPRIVLAHGGIGSLSVLLPVYAALACLSVALFIWLILTIYLLAIKPDEITKKKVKFYNGFSIFIFVILILICSVGIMLAPLLALLLFLVAVVVLTITIFVSSRAKRLMQSESDVNNNKSGW